ncbi:enoyl-CoA hydratase/isomerase family protein [Nocardia sp. CA-084685]|uniref:enoyl-CoA hydratase/isomerase family protein n=1 Tax=Nocardia sp. CA-084685 TaxID=3239970 RepID=UPI003D984191
MTAGSKAQDVSVVLRDDHVATVEIRRAPSNFFDVGLIGRLADACDELAAGNQCRAVVLCSEGRNFCAGADFGHSDPVGRRGGPDIYDIAMRLFEQPLPIVAAVQGAAVGGGLGLALAADFRIASEDSRFSANFALLGFHQGFGLSVTLPAVVGQQVALDLLYSGRRMRGGEAFRVGLCDRLVEPDELRARAHAFAAEIARSAPLAVRSIRETMRRPLVSEVRAVVGRERGEQRRLMQTVDWHEGVAAVRARRAPDFIGR